MARKTTQYTSFTDNPHHFFCYESRSQPYHYQCLLFAVLALFCFLDKMLVRHQDVTVGPWDLIIRKGPHFTECSQVVCLLISSSCIFYYGAILLLVFWYLVCGMWFCTGSPGICNSRKYIPWATVCVQWGIYPCIKIPALYLGPFDWQFFWIPCFTTCDFTHLRLIIAVLVVVCSGLL